MDFLREFYDIIGECGIPRPPYEAWRAWATDNAELWPVCHQEKMVGGVLWKGSTVHIAVRPGWHGRWVRPSHMRAWRAWNHQTTLYATPSDDNAEACALAKRLGFREAPERAVDAFGPEHERLAAGKKIFVKEAPCHPQ